MFLYKCISVFLFLYCIFFSIFYFKIFLNRLCRRRVGSKRTPIFFMVLILNGLWRMGFRSWLSMFLSRYSLGLIDQIWCRFRCETDWQEVFECFLLFLFFTVFLAFKIKTKFKISTETYRRPNFFQLSLLFFAFHFYHFYEWIFLFRHSLCVLDVIYWIHFRDHE